MSKKRVCLDPGHYGSKYNKGAVDGYYESAIMWKLTMLEKDVLERMGIEVVLTRNNIYSNPELTARGKMSKGCDLFISNHSNACDTPAVNRVSTIYFVNDTDETADEKSKDFAAKIAKVVRDTMGVSVYKTYSKLAGGDRDGDGKKDDNYYGVLHGAALVNVPGVIVEHSFHTNPATCEWLMNDANLKKLAEAEAKCIAEWLGVSTEVKKAEPASENFKVKVSINNLNIRKGPGTNYSTTGKFTGPGVFTIVDTASGKGSDDGWGKLKSGAGWISLDYAKRI